MSEPITTPRKQWKTTVVLSISLPPALVRAVSKRASADSRSVSNYMKTLVERDLALVK